MSATKRRNRRPSISKARLAEMIEEATVDAYGEAEQVTGWFTMIDGNLAVPFETTILGVLVTVERVDLNRTEQIVAVCRRGRDRQSLPILSDVPSGGFRLTYFDRDGARLDPADPATGVATRLVTVDLATAPRGGRAGVRISGGARLVNR